MLLIMKKLYKNILLPVDGSQQSIDAFKKGVQQAKAWKSNVFLVQVLPEDADETNIRARTSFLKALEKHANENGVSLHKEIIYGDPRTEIAETLIDRWDIDLIVMGATGKGRLKKIVLGSVTSYVLRNAKCDVMISR